MYCFYGITKDMDKNIFLCRRDRLYVLTKSHDVDQIHLRWQIQKLSL